MYEVVCASHRFISSFCLGWEEQCDYLQWQIFPGTDLFLMCYSINNLESFENIKKKWMPEVRRVFPKGMAYTK